MLVFRHVFGEPTILLARSAGMQPAAHYDAKNHLNGGRATIALSGRRVTSGRLRCGREGILKDPAPNQFVARGSASIRTHYSSDPRS